MYSTYTDVNKFVGNTHRKVNMSAIREEGIGFGGNDIQPENPPTNTPQVTSEIFSDLKEQRTNALSAAKKELEEAFPSEEEVQSRNISSRKSVEDTKKLLNNFREKTANYPKYISYEGSMVLCVLLSMKPVAAVSMCNLPMVDQSQIRDLLPATTNVGGFDVKFDSNKDFVLIFNPHNHKDIILNMFNSVAHPRTSDLKDSHEVPIEDKGDKIEVGGVRKIFDKQKIQKLAGIELSDSKQHIPEEKEYSPQKQVGRNAYEIRADVLQMAIDWSRIEDSSKGYKKPSDDEVISLAKKFYSFVENRR